MNCKRTLSALAALVLAASTLAGCAAQPQASASPAPNGRSITVTDASGQTLTVALPVERTLLLDTGPFQVLDAFGKLGLVVGSHQAIADDPLYAELASLPVVATYSEVNYEKLAQLQPQVVVSSVQAHGVVTDDENLSGFDIRDVKVNLRNPDTMRGDIAVLGKVFDSEDKAAQLIAFYDKWERFIAEREKGLSDAERVKVFVEYHAGSFKTGAPGSRFYQQVVLAGGVNLARDLAVGSEPEVSAEWVVRQDPDVIIREASGLGYSATSPDAAQAIYRELTGRAGLAATRAVQDRNVHLVSVDLYSRPGYIVGVCYMAKWFYPALFEDFDPETVLREYFALLDRKSVV